MRFSNNLVDNGNGQPLYYETSSILDGTTAIVHPNESKTFTDLGNTHYLNYAAPSPYQTHPNTLYSITSTAPGQLLTKSDPNLSPVRQPPQYQSVPLFDSVNNPISEQALWSTSEYQSFVSFSAKTNNIYRILYFYYFIMLFTLML